jgi:hypothetical protein
MQSDFTRYLSDVFRKSSESTEFTQPLSANKASTNSAVVRDPNPFIVDQKYALCLDEII